MNNTNISNILDLMYYYLDMWNIFMFNVDDDNTLACTDILVRLQL